MTRHVDEDARRHLAALELSPGASLAEIKQAYRDLARVWHPDRFSDPRLARRAQERLTQINLAYAWLRRHPDAVARLTSPPPAPPRARPAAPARSAPAADPDPTPPPPPPPTMRPRRGSLLWWGLCAGGAVVAVVAVIRVPPRAAVPSVAARPTAAAPADGTAASDARAPLADAANLEAWMAVVQAVATPTPPAGAAATPGIIPPGYFGLGSTPQEVLTVQGSPTAADDDAWSYGLSKVYFAARPRDDAVALEVDLGAVVVPDAVAEPGRCPLHGEHLVLR
jgi:hypothetical protein